MSKVIHLIYIHGFQGNDSTFQSFPLDLQNHISERVASNLDITFRSSLYPTYKTVKPLSHATNNFLEWLRMQPPGPVILLGHSMGGLLAAEAATTNTNPSTTNDPQGCNDNPPQRIIGVIAFDTPFLGMHPHVVISGIASLLPKGDDPKNLEKEMNKDPNITIVPDQVTDDWEKFKRDGGMNGMRTDERSLSGSSNISPSPPSSSSPTSTSSSTQVSYRSSSSSFSSPQTHFIDRAMNFASSKAESPFMRWIAKHSNDPIGSGKRWIIERLQYGSAMFDPSDLKERYVRLVEWKDGKWINYWTHTVPLRPDGQPINQESQERKEEEVAYNDYALVESGIVKEPLDGIGHGHGNSQQPNKLSSSIEKEWMQHIGKVKKSKPQDKRKKEKREMKDDIRSPRHFVVLPKGLGKYLGGEENWEKVAIGGVKDEVSAHCGLFIRGQNLDYEGLLKRVADKVLNMAT